MAEPETAGASLIDSDPIAGVLAELHARDRRQARSSLRIPYLRRRLRTWLTGRPMNWDRPAARAFFADKLVALDPEKARLCYFLCRASGARRVVEVGTSFGVSTIYLAAAVRENMELNGDGRGILIGTEIEPQKAAEARRNLARAGLADITDVREGDFRETLQDVGGQVEFVLMDIWAPLARSALDLLVPQLRPGAIVACDNVVRFRRDYRDYLARVREPGCGFLSMTVPLDGGLELSMRLS